MALPMVGGVYLGHLWRGTTGKLRALARPLLKDGIGDRMDKGNLWVVPGFTLLVFAILWTTKLSKIALEESTCRGASIYDFAGTQLDEDAKRHCQTAKRYYVGPDEAISLDHNWRKQREVKNPEWILWFWAPIVFVMYVLTRFMWTLLLENQGINFANVVSASQSITVEHDGITEIDEEKLADRLPVIVENFRCAYSSRAYAAFLAFECSLVMAPLLLLLFVLPLMIGGGYRSWGFDIARAWWERRDWQGSPLVPFYFHETNNHRPVVPLIPRITYCDYHFVSLGNSHTLTYRCYMDANWHERTALFTWVMLSFLAMINFGNLFFWFEWTIRMRFRHQRRGWVIKKWLNADGFNEAELALMMRFAESFKMGQLLYFYYIEAHTDRVVASAFCTALFARWLEKRQRRKTAALAIGMPPPDDDSSSAAQARGSVGGTAAMNAYNAVAMPLIPNEVVVGAPPLLPDGPINHHHYHTVSTPYRPPPDCTIAQYKHPSQQHHQRQKSKYFVVQTEPFGPTRMVKRGKDEETAPLTDITTPEHRKSGRRWSIRDMMRRMSINYGWNIGMEMPPLRPVPTAPYPTPPNAASFSDASTAMMRSSRSHSIIHSPRSPPGDVVPPELAMGTPSTSALVGRRKARSPNLAAEIGRDSLCRGPEEEERRAERRKQAEERKKAEQEEAEKAKQLLKKDKSFSSSISSSSEDEDERSKGGGVVTERVPKNSNKRTAIVTERTPLVEGEQRQQTQQQQQQQDETAKRKHSKEKSPSGKANGTGASSTRNVTPPGRNRPTPPGRAGNGGGKQPLQRQDEAEEEEE